MSVAHRRSKRPDLIRHSLLDAALQIVVEDGPHAVTLEAVAQRAGVTKGGLQHHFPGKRALLDTLFDCLFHDFEGELQAALDAEADTPGRHARAYIRQAFASHAETPSQRALLLLGLSWPPYAARWRQACVDALQVDSADPDDTNRLLLCRLAADGLWSAQIFDTYALDGERRQALLDLLLRLCDGDVR